MPRLSKRTYSETINGEHVVFDFVPSVSATGVFSATLPKPVAEEMLASSMVLVKNRAGSAGYVASTTLVGLYEAIDELVRTWKSRTLVSEKIVLEYVIETAAVFSLDLDGMFVPNAYWVQGDARCFRGTRDIDTSRRSPHGVRIYVRPVVEKKYHYRDGSVKITSERRTRENHLTRGDTALDFLGDLACMEPPTTGACPVEVMRIDYTEEIGAWFVRLIRSLWKLTLHVGRSLDPADIAEMAKTGTPLFEVAGKYECGPSM